MVILIPSPTSLQALPSKWAERETLRKKGQFWTPCWVADAMIRYVARNTDLVFDPATGRGAFYEALLRSNKTKVSFLGTDIDHEVLTDPVYKSGNCSIEKRDFIKNPPQRKFPAIVANPPYIRHHRIDGETKQYLKKLSLEITGHSIDGRAGLHIYFLIQALNLLAENGRLAFIMPADTCEGKFAHNLWKWIAQRFRIDAVITFDEKATPFPKVDTNALIFLIKKANPRTTLHWVRVQEADPGELSRFISSNFKKQPFKTLEVTSRQVKEGIETGLSRPEQHHKGFKFHLNDFATVIRGIATGCNEFFFLTAPQVKELGIAKRFFKRAIGRTKDAAAGVLTGEDINRLEKENRPTYLLSINGQDQLPEAITNYLRKGESMGLPTRALIQQRKPWYKMEQRTIPPLLFAYLGRREIRFIRNEAGVVPLTGFLCVYPVYEDEVFVNKLWQALNHPDTLEHLKLVGKSYGSGAIKVEPGNLAKLPIPEHVVDFFGLRQVGRINSSR